MRRSSSSRTSGSNERIPTTISARSGMMLLAEPAWKAPTVTTVGSIGWMLRETIDCSAMTIEAPQTIGSAVSCGSAPWPPRPCTVMRASSTAAMIGPSRKANWPNGRPGSL
ncbi:hypothetical protein D3C80_1893550 [compost metagenome]